MSSKNVALSAVSAGLVALFLLVGAYFEMADVFTVVIASVFVLLPLYYNSFKGSFLAYLVGGLVGFMCSGFNIMSLVFPAYFAFFGIYPIVKFLFLKKNVNKVFSFVVGLVWLIAVSIGLYFYYTMFMGIAANDLPQWVAEYIILFVVALAVVFFVVFDRFLIVVRRVLDYYLRRIIK